MWTAKRSEECAFGIWSNKWRIFQRLLNVSPNFAVDFVKAHVVLHNFVRERDNCNFEDAMTLTGLEDVPDGLSVCGGVNRGQCKESSGRLFSKRCWGSCLENVKNINSRVHKMKKKISLYVFQLDVSNKLWQYSPTAFFNISWNFEVFLRTNTNFCQCLFLFDPVFIIIIRLVPLHWPGFHHRYWHLNVELKIADLHLWKALLFQ